MQNRNVSNIKGGRSRINFRFIALLTVVFLIQQLSFAALHQSLFPVGQSYCFLHYKEKQPAQEQRTHFSLDIEVEVAEEDEVHGSDEGSEFTLASLHVILTRLYTSSVKSRYQHLAFAVHHQVNRPLFMLHHSWKSHLS